MRIFVLALALAKLCLISGGAAAENCANLALWGVYDYRSTHTSHERASSFRNWYCSQNFQTAKTASDVAASIGIPIENVPIKLGYSGKEEEFSSWQRSYCDDASTASSATDVTEEFVATINQGVEKAILQCLKMSGVHFMILPSDDPRQFLFGYQYTRLGDELSPNFSFFGFSKGVQCTPPINPGTPIRTAIQYTACVRKTDDVVNIVANVDRNTQVHLDSPMSLAAIGKPQPSEQYLREACKEIFRAPRDLKFVADRYEQALSLAEKALLEAASERENRIKPSDHEPERQIYFDEASIVRNFVRDSMHAYIQDAGSLTTYVDGRAAACNRLATPGFAVASLPHACQAIVDKVGEASEQLQIKALGMAAAIADSKATRDSYWGTPADNTPQDPTAHRPDWDRARVNEMDEFKRLFKTIDEMESTADPLYLSLRQLPPLCGM